MYIWIVLTSFMVALAAFTISPRDDGQVLKTFQAEGYAGNITTVNAAARSYITPLMSTCSASSCSYASGLINEANYSPAYPPGFQKYSYVKAQVFCFNIAAPLVSVACTANTHNYLVTYATSLGRFEALDGEYPAYAVRKSLAEMTGYSIKAGLVVKKAANTDSDRDALNSTAAVQSMGGIYKYLPMGMMSVNGGPISYGDIVFVSKLTHSTEALPSP